MPHEYRVTAVVVTYNRKKLLRECLEALLRQKTDNEYRLNVLIMDNAGTDGSKEYISDLLKKNHTVTYVRLNRNLGGAGGFHYGMKQAVEEGADAVWIMDDDTIPREDALIQLIHGMKSMQGKAGGRRDIGYVSSRVLWTDGTPCKMNLQHFLDAGNRKRNCLTVENGIRPIDQATFVSLLFPSETVIKAGLPLKEYFIWGDDKEYTLRIAKAASCYYIPDSVVIHKMGQNSGSNITYDDVLRIPRYFYAYRNDFATARSHGAGELVVYFAAFGLNLCRILLHSPDHKTERIKVMWRGLAAGMRFRPVVSYVKDQAQTVGEKV